MKLASALVTIVLAAAIVFLWLRETATYQPAGVELTDWADVQRALSEAGATGHGVRLPTGLFVQSLEFEDANDVQVTGYVWQVLDAARHADVRPSVVFPEAVGEGVLERAYERVDGPRRVVGWYFEKTLRQEFDYRKYPLDHKTVWIRLWYGEPDSGIVLVPDLDSYVSTARGTSFGLDQHIVLRGWNLRETFFTYRTVDYDTNFGIHDMQGGRFPELYFNVVIHRQFLSSFIVHLVPLLVIGLLAFAILLTVSEHRDEAERHGFDTMAAISGCSALVFVVMLAHAQLRSSLADARIVYLEKFYLLSYVVILGVAVDAYLMSLPGFVRKLPGWMAGNRLPKLAFWPLTLLVVLLVTIAQL